MEIPEEHKRTIRRLVSRNKAVAQAACDIPHQDPKSWLKAEVTELPYCGCFVGVYAWMQECANGREMDLSSDIHVTNLVANHTGISLDSVSNFGAWCNTELKDRLAVRYARELLSA